MQLRAHGIGREVGTALAVLALYVLTLLLPLHQVAGMQRELSALGYETVGAWSVCEDAAASDEGEPGTAIAVKCPATGISKYEFVAPPAGGPETIRVEASVAVLHAPPGGVPAVSVSAHFGQSRAPPAEV